MTERPKGAQIAGGALGVLVLVGLAGAVWFGVDTNADDAGREASSPAPTATASTANEGDATTRARAREGSARAKAEAEAVDPKLALLEQRDDVEDPDPHSGVDFDEPRPGPDAELHDAESEREAALEPGEKAAQSWRMHGALSARAAAVREQVEAARADGDPEEAARLEQILARLEQRAEVLASAAEQFEAEAEADAVVEAEADE